MQTEIDVVVSRYNRPTEWTENFYQRDRDRVRVLIYDKETPSNPYNIPINKGNEASVYLKYIMDHYDSLPEYVFFIHDEEFAWHHSGSIFDRFDEAVSSGELYYNINDNAIMEESYVISEVHGAFCHFAFLAWYNAYIDPYIPFASLPKHDFTKGHRASAQFLVHRDRIRRLPRDFYQNLYEWIITTTMESQVSGRFFEWTWHVFWDINPQHQISAK